MTSQAFDEPVPGEGSSFFLSATKERFGPGECSRKQVVAPLSTLNRWKNILVVGTWIFCAAFVADAVNMTDLFPGISTIHEDEDMGSGGKSLDFSLTTTPAVPSQTQSPNHHPKDPTSKANASKVTIFDQDSPCVAGATLSSILPSFLYPDEEVRTYVTPVSGGTIYLKLCTLLI